MKPSQSQKLQKVQNSHQEEQGVILIGAMFVMMFFMVVSMAVADFAVSHYVNTKRSLNALSALSIAEAGAEKFMLEINKNKTHVGTNGACPGIAAPTTLFDNTAQGKGTYETCVEAGSFSNEKIVYSTGRLYTPAGGANPISIRKIKLIIRGTNPFEYALQTGTGPLYMYGNTGFVGSVYSNQHIIIQDNSVNVSGSFYMVGRKDASGNCSMSGNGDVSGSTIKANYKVTQSPCGIDAPGSSVSENLNGTADELLPKQLPSIDKAGIIGGITSAAACTSTSNTPYTLNNRKYTSNGTMGGSACTVTLEKNKSYSLKGNVYIPGDLLIDGNIITLDSSVNSDTYIIVEGKVKVVGNGSSIAGNSNPVGIIVASYDNGDAVTVCGPSNDNCIKNYNDSAIDIKGNSLSLNALFMTENGSLSYKGRGSIGSMAGKSIVMNGSGLTNFIKVNVASQDANIWNVTYYQQDYNY